MHARIGTAGLVLLLGVGLSACSMLPGAQEPSGSSSSSGGPQSARSAGEAFDMALHRTCLRGEQVAASEIVPAEWDRLLRVGAYTSAAQVNEAAGFEVTPDTEHWGNYDQEHFVLLLFEDTLVAEGRYGVSAFPAAELPDVWLEPIPVEELSVVPISAADPEQQREMIEANSGCRLDAAPAAAG